MVELLMVALGGNALVQAGQPASIKGQRSNLRGALQGVAELVCRGTE
jgi:carbamate kinase